MHTEKKHFEEPIPKDLKVPHLPPASPSPAHHPHPPPPASDVHDAPASVVHKEAQNDVSTVAVSHEGDSFDPSKPYFKLETPKNILDGIGGTEYNLVKGDIAGPALLLVAPVTGAVDGVNNGKNALESTGGFFTGFGKGVVRGVVGSSALIVSGSIAGANQFRRGIVNAQDAPGQGHGIKENIDHILNEPFLHLAGNVEPASFKEDIAASHPPSADGEAAEGTPSYQFFLTSEPTGFADGLAQGQYNACKGFISGATLLVGAPIKDTIEGYTANGYEGAVRGFGSGATRGFVGGVTLASTGLVLGASQIGRGFASLDNIPTAVEGCKQVGQDFHVLLRTPIVDLVMAGHGANPSHEALHNHSHGHQAAPPAVAAQ